MTKQRDFKSLVRQRMAKTGESYTTARAQLLMRRNEPEIPTGGIQPDVSATRNLLSSVGVNGPDGKPLSEAMAFGLAGGIGFLYGVFDYQTGPTMTIVARSKSMPDPFVETLLQRTNMSYEVLTTTSEGKAGRQLDQVLDDGRQCLITVGEGCLPYLQCDSIEAATSPHVVGVVGQNGSTVLIDDCNPRPIQIERADLDQARAAYAQAKYRLVTVSPDSPTTGSDWLTAELASIVRNNVELFNTPPVPQFASNIGLAGLEKWAKLARSGSAKGWLKIFDQDRRAAIALTRLSDTINHSYTTQSAGRPLYADFLTEAAALVGQSRWGEAAEIFTESGDHWQAIVETALASSPSVARYAQISEDLITRIDQASAPNVDLETISNSVRSLRQQQAELVNSSKITTKTAASAYETIAGHVEQIVSLETQALKILQD